MKMPTPKISYRSQPVTTKTLESEDHLIVLSSGDDTALRKFPHGETMLERVHRTSRNLKDGEFVFDLPNRRGTRVALCGIKANASAFDLLTIGRRLAAAMTKDGAERVAVAVAGLDARSAERAVEAVVAALLAAALPLPSFKSKRDKRRVLKEIIVPGPHKPAWLDRVIAEAHGNHLARSLTALPPNELTPASYRKQVEKLARAHGWKTQFLDQKKLRALGAGAFLAVAQGSPEPDAGILHLQYRPKQKTKAPIALVGKGICFDTGGTNLKPARHMHGMHEDMEGSAVALGTLLALTELKADIAVDCWLALAQNHIGPKAYRQNEVITAANGTTIEIVHTDAEGRMILADTLTLATRTKPGLVIDYATLTGACVAALSTRMSGVLTNRPQWLPTLIKSGEDSGERVWPFPLPDDYEEALKSEIADVKQCTLDNDADHILAAVFLKKFLVDDPAWIHVDLSSGNHKGGLAHIPTDVTGFGVRFTLNLLLDQKLIT
jgi:leucyl aminopeptidase